MRKILDHRARSSRYAGAIFAAAWLTASLASAMPFDVNSTLDAPDADPGDGTCATATGVCTLRAAVQEANALPGKDTINLPPGTFTLSIAGAGEDAAATGDLDVTDLLEIIGAGPESTVIDAGGIDRAFDITGGIGFFDTVLVLTGLTIRNGHAEGDGGAIRHDTLFSFVGLASVVIQNSTATESGGSIYSRGSVALDRCVIEGGRAGGAGGGIIAAHGSTDIRDTTIRNNAAAGDGGGIYYASSEGGLGIDRSLITANSAGANGGGIASELGGVGIRDSSVSGNLAGNSGGGVYSFGPLGAAYLTASTVNGNEALDGGGLFFDSGVLKNSTVSGNRAARDGGGIHAEGADLDNATLTNNVADSNGDGVGDGGGVFLLGSPYHTMQNTILAGNRDRGLEAPDCAGHATSGGHNLIENPSGCTIDGDTTGNLVGVAPRLGPLADNGGPTPTHALLAGSPAIDAGDPGTPGSGGTACESKDQRGLDRPQLTRCDIGAFEFACGNRTVDPGEECDDGNTADGDCCSANCERKPSFDVDGDGEARVATDIVYIARHFLGLVPVPPSFRVTDPAIPPDSAIAAVIDACAGATMSTTSTTATSTTIP